uniref:Thioredoxin domain-containing protein n=1 Tax=Palpitomonas bilix TaxID=652834 RepID=A0A7S3GM59_9EUKA|mmetsp:Transcript_9154/g.24821  ORF Transcript_9154/g.24821 Transcript_9154/m.24821 type:complete len:191 (+) Transcript_9154:195-767(+)|eukprot:CAMPEP_0113889662 /NCGR_PEP_ID=MMETSP0780_2-20120614/13645_1 /TAXON_ID=652834 /ORGANISM="Palpitomonas bilix" /LENGTH=190 /DNA_ID=CAMNT_0000878833 /DNA_START=157 /DNA_END=729 /DNA_ORIENTATION=- /assembly_acc=CAM_ASM_000599
MSGGGVIDSKVANFFSTFDHLLDCPTAITAAIESCKEVKKERDRARKRGEVGTVGGHQRVLLIFGANWSPACAKLKEVIEQDPVKPVLDAHFSVILIDVEGPFNIDLNKAYGEPIMLGVPSIVILNEEGEAMCKVGTNTFETDAITAGSLPLFSTPYSAEALVKFLDKYKYEEARPEDVSPSSSEDEGGE